MKVSRRITVLAAVGLVLGGLVGMLMCAGKPNFADAVDSGRPAKMRPDYAGVTVPPNIAPLNFVVDEPGRRYCLKITSAGGKQIEILNDDGRFAIPQRAWRETLAGSSGKSITYEIFVRQADKSWMRFSPFTQNVAAEPIDSHLVYRLMPPIYNIGMDMGIYQRDLTGYDESAVVTAFIYKDGGCLNCHTFQNNNPNRMFFQSRPLNGDKAMIVIDGGKVSRVQVSGGQYKYPAAIGSWTPDGGAVAFTMDRFLQFFHAAGPEPREVMELDGNIAMYNLAGAKITSAPDLMDSKYISTYPCWAPDGKSLYYCRTPLLWTDKSVPSVELYRKVRYEIMQIPYDPQAQRWGRAKVLLSLPDKSLTQPRVSPDGRFVLFCAADCGPFPTFRAESDLYMMDLKTGGHWRLDKADSPLAESWHCWSSNGKWIVFTSRRVDGLLGLPFICHIDADGNAAKPFLLPQKDAAFYDRNLNNYNVPELVTGPVKVDQREIARIADERKTGRSGISITGATPKASPPTTEVAAPADEPLAAPGEPTSGPAGAATGNDGR